MNIKQVLNLPPSTLMSWNGLVTLAHYVWGVTKHNTITGSPGTLPNMELDQGLTIP
jgi:hypothetical protein